MSVLDGICLIVDTSVVAVIVTVVAVVDCGGGEGL